MTRIQKLIVALLLSAVRELVLPGYQEITNAHEIVAIEENGRLVQLVPVTSNRDNLGIIAIYDNPMTRRAEDYLELRDDRGQIVAIEWFDHSVFGG